MDQDDRTLPPRQAWFLLHEVTKNNGFGIHSIWRKDQPRLGRIRQSR
jgi:hypothetical protein